MDGMCSVIALTYISHNVIYYVDNYKLNFKYVSDGN